MYNNNTTIYDLVRRRGGLTIAYEIPPELKPSMNDIKIQIDTDDKNFGIDREYTKLMVEI